MRESERSGSRRRGVWATGAMLAAVLLSPPPARAAAATVYQDVVDVQEVEMTLVARGSDGAPLRDLTAAELRLYEDGVAVPIAQLRRGETADAVASAAAASLPSAPPMHLAVFVDEIHIGAARRPLLDHVAAVLAQRLRPQDEVMVARYDGALRVALPFTRDRRALAAALADAQTITGERLAVEEERRQMMESVALDAAGAHGWSKCLHIQEFVQNYADRERERVENAAASLGAFVGAMSALGGRKVLLHLSDGIPLQPGAEAADLALRLCNGQAATQGETGSVDERYADVFDSAHRSLAGIPDSTRIWDAVLLRAASGEVTIETMQAGGGNESRARSAADVVGRGALLTPQAQSAALQDTLYLLAERTGGHAMMAGADVERDLAAALDEVRGSYRLSYVPPPRPVGAERRVRLECTRPGVALAYRDVYHLQTVYEQAGEQLLARLLLGSEGESSAAAVELIGHTTGTDGAVKARFRLSVPVTALALTDGASGRNGRVTLMLAIADASGRTSPVKQATLPVRVAAGATPSADVAMEIGIALRPGPHRVGLAVRDETNGALSFLVREVDVPGI